METITGEVEAYSPKTKGVKVNENWLNPSEEVKGFVEKASPKKGDKIEAKVDVETGKMTFFKVVGKSNGNAQQNSYQPAFSAQKETKKLGEADKSRIVGELGDLWLQCLIKVTENLGKSNINLSEYPKESILQFVGQGVSTLFIQSTKEIYFASQ